MSNKQGVPKAPGEMPEVFNSSSSPWFSPTPIVTMIFFAELPQVPCVCGDGQQQPLKAGAGSVARVSFPKEGMV